MAGRWMALSLQSHAHLVLPSPTTILPSRAPSSAPPPPPYSPHPSYWLGHDYVKKVPLDAEYGDLESTRPKHLQVAAAL